MISLAILIYRNSANERCTTEGVGESERVSAATWFGSAGSAQILIYRNSANERCIGEGVSESERACERQRGYGRADSARAKPQF